MTSGLETRSESPSSAGGIGLGLLVFNGFLCAILSVLFLPAYLGAVPFPVSILGAAIVNLLLVVAARSLVPRASSAVLPLAAWAFGFLLCMFGGPGGDVFLLADIRTLLLLVGAIAPAAVYLGTKSLAVSGAAGRGMRQ